MANTITNIKIPEKIWVNIYELSGINVGTKIIIQNVGSQDVWLNSGESAPVDQTAYVLCRSYEESINETSDLGAWAYSHTGTFINVRIATQ